MTISSVINRKDYQGDGSTTAFPVPYKFLANAHLDVRLRVTETQTETVQTLTTHYTVTGAGVDNGGTLTMVTAPPVGTNLTILRDTPTTQLTDYVENDLFDADLHEEGLDKLTMLIQDLDEVFGRCVVQAITDTGTPIDPDDFAAVENVVVARIDGSVDGSGDYPWTQMEPINSSATWQVKSGGLVSTAVGNAAPFVACTTIATNTIVLMLVANDSGDTVRYRFSLPGVCPSA